MKRRIARKLPAILVMALGLGSSGSWVAATALGGPIEPNIGLYTTGTIYNSRNVTGTPVVSFQGNPGASSSSGEPFSLGEFHVTALPEGVGTHYDRTPFALDLHVTQVNGAGVPTVDYRGWLAGELDGTVRGSDYSEFDAHIPISD